MTEKQIRANATKLVEFDRRLSAMIIAALPERMNIAALTAKLKITNREFSKIVKHPSRVPLFQLAEVVNALGASGRDIAQLLMEYNFDKLDSKEEVDQKNLLH